MSELLRVSDRHFVGILPKRYRQNTIFIRCDFIGMRITDVKNLQFFDCSFENIQFTTKRLRNDDRAVREVEFVRPRGKSIRFSSAMVVNCKIIRPDPELIITFSDCIFNENFSIDRCKDQLKIVVDDRCTSGEKYIERISNSKIPLYKRIFLWNTIEFIQGMKLPQFSIALTTILALMAASINLGYFSGNLTLAGESPIDAAFKMEFSWPSFTTKWTFWATGALFILSAVHLAIRPQECSVRSLFLWKREYNGMEQQFYWYQNSRWAIRHIVLFSYIILSFIISSAVVRQLLS